MAKKSTRINIGDTSFFLPVRSLMAVQLKNPQIIPCVMEYVIGIKIMLKNAGIASSYLFQLMFKTGVIIKIPTIMRTGAVAMDGTTERSGEKNMKGKNKTPATTAVKPVLPPAAIPVADSM